MKKINCGSEVVIFFIVKFSLLKIITSFLCSYWHVRKTLYTYKLSSEGDAAIHSP